MATLKTYAFWGYHPGIDPDRPWVRQATAAVAARSMAEVARLLSGDDERPVRLTDINNLSETGNLPQIVLALGAPGIIFHANQFSTNYRPVGGRPLGVAPTQPETLIADYAKRYPRSNLAADARKALPEIRAAWDAARALWPDATFAR
jgi:hypothetical protein